MSIGSNKQDLAPALRQPDNGAALEQSGEPKAQAELLSSKPADYQWRQGNRRPVSGNRRHSPRSKKRVETAPGNTWNPSEFQVAPVEGKTRFHDLDLPVEIMHGIHDLGFEYCTPVQAETLPKALARLDVTGKAQTGTGKTAAFLITILTHLKRRPLNEKPRAGTPRALIMVPTRELAIQVNKEANLLGKYCRCKISAVFGGMDYQKQKQMLTETVVDIVVATPGRLLDFKRQGDVDLSKVEILVIDEADEMLNMGFIPDIRQIVNSTPPKSKRQTMLFGATLTPDVIRLASQWTSNPVTVEIDPEQVAVDSVEQLMYLIRTRERFTVLYNMITQQNLKRVLVFCNRRDQTRRLADQLRANGINCAVLSGDIAQKKRIRTIEDFRSGTIRVMVATDVAGRGIHIEGISHVVNYNLPLDPEDYVHRIGRTGRAGATGTSVGFATEDESFQIPAIEKYLAGALRCVYPDDALLTPVPPPAVKRGITAKPASLRARASSG
ncbi:MAG: DEAD/DEAH box helicase [Dehalococcoidia bacterium]|nr:DEAD/DEAH box helicase [Dehalococcoidia bacterium]